MESKKYDILKGMMKYLDFKKDDLIKGDGALSLLMPISYPVIDDETIDPINTHEEAAHAFEGIGEYMMDRYYEHPNDFGVPDYDDDDDDPGPDPLYWIIQTNNGPKMKVTIADKLAMVIQMLSGDDARALSSSAFGGEKTHRELFVKDYRGSFNPEWAGFALLKEGEGDSVYLSRYFGNESGLGLINNISYSYEENDDIDTWKKLDGVSWNDIIK